MGRLQEDKRLEVTSQTRAQSEMRAAHLMVHNERASQNHLIKLRELHWSQTMKTTGESRERGTIHHRHAVKKLSSMKPNDHQEEASEMDQSVDSSNHEAHTRHNHCQELNHVVRFPESSTSVLLLQTIMSRLHSKDVLNEEPICQKSSHLCDKKEDPIPLLLEDHS